MSLKETSFFEGAIDKGLEGVVVCSSDVSAIQNSRLFLRGYLLEDLALHSSYSEVAYLLWEGRLPSAAEREAWREDLSEASHLTGKEQALLKQLPANKAHPMAWLRTAVSALSLLQDSELSPENPALWRRAGISLVGKTPLLIAFFHCLREGKPMPSPKKGKSLAWNFLHALKGEEPSPETEKILDKCLILHADHDLNCSAFSARVTASSLSDGLSAVVSAIGALKGPLHGGANEQALKMLSRLSSVKEGKRFIDEALAKKQKVMGFGHRVYRERDPRADILKPLSKKLCAQTGRPELFAISEAMEKRMREKKGLCPNVDFYSASVYHCLGIPSDLFTPVFAMARMAGWLAHIFEQYEKNRIYRPRSKWLGEMDKKWKPLEERE